MVSNVRMLNETDTVTDSVTDAVTETEIETEKRWSNTMPYVRSGNHIVDCKGVVFDKDGTLIDSLKIWPELIRTRVALLRENLGFGQGVSDLAERVMGLRPDGSINRKSVIVIGSREQTASSVSAVLSLELDLAWDQALAATLAAFAMADEKMVFSAQAIPVPGTLELLQELYDAGIKIGIATNDSKDRTLALMEAAGLSRWISAFACRDEVTSGKPAPDLLQLVCSRLQLEPRECLMVGDSVMDMHMADQAGGVKWKIGVLTGASQVQDFRGYTDVVCSSVRELHAHVQTCPV